MIVVGVHGCKGGWVTVEWNVDESTIELDVLNDFEKLLEKYPEGKADAIAIDTIHNGARPDEPVGRAHAGQLAGVPLRSSTPLTQEGHSLPRRAAWP